MGYMLFSRHLSLTFQAVQQVINNLLISHVELRGDESPDIKPYTHERRVEKIVVKLGDELNSVRTKYVRVSELCPPEE